VRDRSAFLDALKARLDQACAEEEPPVEDAAPRRLAEAPIEGDLRRPATSEPTDVAGDQDWAVARGHEPGALPPRPAGVWFEPDLWKSLAGEGAALWQSREDEPLWQSAEDEPPAAIPAAGRRGTWIAAVVVASVVVLLVGSGLGIMPAGWQIELPSRPIGTAAPPPPAAESEAAPAAPRAPPTITEILRVERPPTPPAATAARRPSDLTATGEPRPPPPKPTPSSSVPGEALATTEAVDHTVETLLREAGGPGSPLEPLGERADPLAATRVFVHYTASAAGAPAKAMHLVRHLKVEGFAAEAREVGQAIESDCIRYFFAADRDQAEALRSSLEGQVPGGGAPRVLDFTRFDPKAWSSTPATTTGPTQGHIELWIRA
jgi:hypothetical protein